MVKKIKVYIKLSIFGLSCHIQIEMLMWKFRKMDMMSLKEIEPKITMHSQGMEDVVENKLRARSLMNVHLFACGVFNVHCSTSCEKW